MLIDGYTYSYVHKEPKDGEKCCRPMKSKCHLKKETKCKIQKGETRCGKGCDRIINAVEKLARKMKKKEEKMKKKEEKKKEGKKKEDES